MLEALYFNHSTEKMTLTCTGVVEVPPIFYPDQYGADGSLTRSLKQHRALLVEDVKPQVLNSLKFEPTDAHFVDDATKETRDFQVLRVTPGEEKTLPVGNQRVAKRPCEGITPLRYSDHALCVASGVATRLLPEPGSCFRHLGNQE